MKNQNPLHNALFGTPTKDSQLENPPLVSAVAQIVFPKIIKIQTTEGIARFQDKLRAHYPETERQVQVAVEINVDALGSGASREQIVSWQLRNEAKNWNISLNQESIALYTSSYETRADFMGKFKQVIQCFVDEFSPGRTKRVGMRYINRIPYGSFDSLRSYINNDLLGILPEGEDNVLHMLTEASLKAKEGTITARWGKMPAQGTTDAVLLPPISNPSWVTDVDLFTNENELFDTEKIVSLVQSLAERHYAFFCWMTMDALRKNKEA